MNYYIYQTWPYAEPHLVAKRSTQEEGIAALDKLHEQWKLNALHTPNLKLCYNGFESITIKEYPAE